MPNSTREPYVTLDDAAEYFAVSRRTLERYIADRRIPARRLGRSVRVKIAEIEDHLLKIGA